MIANAGLALFIIGFALLICGVILPTRQARQMVWYAGGALLLVGVLLALWAGARGI